MILLLYILAICIAFVCIIFCIFYIIYRWYSFKPDIKNTQNNDNVTYKEYILQKHQANYLKHARFIQNNPDESNVTINIMNEYVDYSSDEISSSSDESSSLSDECSSLSDESSV